MAIAQKIDTDIITAMRAREEHRLTTLRMVKSALKNKAIDKRADLTEAEELQILSTLIKQRKESVDSFLKGNRPELAQKEREEITIIEGYMPQEAGREDGRASEVPPRERHRHIDASPAMRTITEPTPMTMPSVVRTLRRPFAAMARSATRRASIGLMLMPLSRRTWHPAPGLA